MKSPRILVVDDEPRAVELLVRTLRKEASIDTADSATSAWELCQTKEYDLVISDQRMPGMSGVDLLSRIAERDDHVGRVLLTGYSDLEATIEAINRGRVHAYLHKPCSPEDLRVVTRGVLARVSLERENVRLLEVVSAQNDQLTEVVESLRSAQERVLMSERLAAIGKMNAMIAHDLRSPIAVIRSNATELEAETRAAGLQQLMERSQEVIAEADRMQRMCTALLEVSSASQGSSARELDELDGLVASALAHVAQPAGHQGVEVDFDLRSDAELFVDADGISRVLRNLASNALDAMPDGGVLRVETSREGDEGIIRLTDTGTGIPEDIAHEIFEPFVTAKKPGGSGLGLAIARKIVEDHDGTIALDKKPIDTLSPALAESDWPEGESGTCFTIRLPLARQVE